MLEAVSPDLRPDYNNYKSWSANNSDILIMTMEDSGILRNGYVINNQAASMNWYLGESQSLFKMKNYYVFGAYSQGFLTRYQNSTYSSSSNLDTYLFLYDVT